MNKFQGDKKLSYKEQIETFDRNYDGAVIALQDIILRLSQPDKDFYKKFTKARFKAGYKMFGDEMFKRSFNDLIEEVNEEVSDALCYLIAAAWVHQNRSLMVEPEAPKRSRCLTGDRLGRLALVKDEPVYLKDQEPIATASSSSSSAGNTLWTIILFVLLIVSIGVAALCAPRAEAHTITKHDCVRIVSSIKAGSAVKRAAYRGCTKYRLNHERAHKIQRCSQLSGAAHAKCMIRLVFKHHAAQAIKIAKCESGFSTTATNGQYRGIFQMGSAERERFGHGSTAYAQAQAAYGYFVLSGYRFTPWSCKA